MGIERFGEDLSLGEIKKDLHGYSMKGLWGDISSGFTVALITLPQAMAYSLVAGLPISCGIFAAIFSAFFAALFGSSRHVVIGPSTAIAILVQVGISETLFTFYRDVSEVMRDALALQILTQICLLVGVLQVLAAFFRLGRLTHFVSDSVVIGYLMGTAVAVVVNQLFVFLGIQSPEGIYSLFDQAIYILRNLHLISFPTFLVGICSLGSLILLGRNDRRVFSAIATLLLSVGLVYLLSIGTSATVHVVGDMGLFTPTFTWPFFHYGIMTKLLPVAFAIALLSTLETCSVARSVAASSGQRLSTNQEILGLGIGNTISAFTGALPCSGSPSRSIMLYNLGGTTRLASMFNSVFVALIVMFFGFFVAKVPLPCLAALLFVNTRNIVNVRSFLLCLKATSSDAFVMLTTFVSCLFFGLDVAFYIGVLISTILYLKKAAMPHLVECMYEDTGQIKSMDRKMRQEPHKIRVINVQGELFFGAADIFQRTLKSITEDDSSTKVIILRLKNARDIDATACLALQQLAEYLRKSDRYLIACGLTEQSWEVLCHSGLIEEMGKENLFIYEEGRPYRTMQRALKRAHQLIAQEEEEAKEATPQELPPQEQLAT